MVHKRFKHLFGDKKKRWMRKLLELFKWVILAALVLLLLALASRRAVQPTTSCADDKAQRRLHLVRPPDAPSAPRRVGKLAHRAATTPFLLCFRLQDERGADVQAEGGRVRGAERAYRLAPPGFRGQVRRAQEGTAGNLIFSCRRSRFSEIRFRRPGTANRLVPSLTVASNSLFPPASRALPHAAPPSASPPPPRSWQLPSSASRSASTRLLRRPSRTSAGRSPRASRRRRRRRLRLSPTPARSRSRLSSMPPAPSFR